MAKSASKKSVAAGKRKPKLGQNFLIDLGAARRIVEALGDVSNRTVVEIGPGRGMLTDLLVPRAKRVIGIELDRVLAAQLRMRYATMPNVEILESDFVTAELISMVGRRPGPLHDLRPTQPETVDVVGNLPYYVTSDIVLRILELHENIGRAVIMVQREVADRIAAEPGSRDYGLLSATAQLFARVDNLFTLPPRRSHLRRRSFQRAAAHHGAATGGIASDEAALHRYLKLAFAQKRKTLVNNLRGHYDDTAVRAALKAAGVRADVRAEAMPLEKMAAVFRALQRA